MGGQRRGEWNRIGHRNPPTPASNGGHAPACSALPARASSRAHRRGHGGVTTWPLPLPLQDIEYMILFHFEVLLHKNIFCKHPLYCAIYCTILPVIAPPRPILRCFSGV